MPPKSCKQSYQYFLKCPFYSLENGLYVGKNSPRVHNITLGQFSSVTQSCLTLYNPMNLSTPGLPVHHQLLKFTQTYVHWVSDAIQPSHSLLSLSQSFPAPGSFQMSQLFASGGQSIGVSASTSVLPVNTQDWSPLGWTGWISWQSKGLSRVFSNTTVHSSQFTKASIPLCSAFFIVQLSHPYMTTEKWQVRGNVVWTSAVAMCSVASVVSDSLQL